MTLVELLQPDVTPEHLGIIPYFLNDDDPDRATTQLNKHYAHGGGWRPFKGHTMNPDHSISYSGDPDLHPLAAIRFRDELVLIYPYSWVAVVQKDGSFEICRMD